MAMRVQMAKKLMIDPMISMVGMVVDVLVWCKGIPGQKRMRWWGNYKNPTSEETVRGKMAAGV
jgi:hypothetical protein